MHALKTGLNADKFAGFWMFPKRFYHLFIFEMTLRPRPHEDDCKRKR